MMDRADKVALVLCCCLGVGLTNLLTLPEARAEEVLDFEPEVCEEPVEPLELEYVPELEVHIEKMYELLIVERKKVAETAYRIKMGYSE